MRSLLVAAAATALSGCSAVQFAYNNAGAWVQWKADSFLDLREAQKAELGQRVAGFFRWNRGQALPEYARLADEAAARLERGATREDMVWGYDAVRGQASIALGEAGAALGDFLDRLEPAQVEHFERALEDDNRRYARRYLEGPPAERRTRRLQRLRHDLEDWLGGLNEAQLERVRRFNDSAPLTAMLRGRERRRMQQELLALMRARRSGGVLADWWAHWDRGREPEFALANREYVDGLLTLLADLERTLSAQQRAHAVSRLREYARDFRVLAAQ
ncbi:MAG TPA: DUF6279 family lipoprotein [Burkholderiales bacterium]|nr:DUF6279 family lipoprotein [Burkholderiales bacterium]